MHRVKSSSRPGKIPTNSQHATRIHILDQDPYREAWLTGTCRDTGANDHVFDMGAQWCRIGDSVTM